MAWSLICSIIGVFFTALYLYILIRRRQNEPGSAVDVFFLRDSLTPATRWVLALLVVLHAAAFFVRVQPLIYPVALFVTAVYATYFAYVLVMQRHQLLDTIFVLGLVLTVGGVFLPRVSGLACITLGLVLIAVAHQFRGVMYAERYRRWSRKKATKLYKKYRHHYKKLDAELRPIVLAIMVVEDVARPAVIRLIERIYAKVHPKLVVTTGLMQVGAKGPLTDEQSVAKGIKIIKKQYQASKKLTDDGHQLAFDIAIKYNGHPTYVQLLGYFFDECVRVIQDNPL